MLDEPALRSALVDAARSLEAAGLNGGTSGNISVRCGSAMLITPSAMDPARMQPSDIARMDLRGHAWEGLRKPSTEWPFHQAILQARADAGAVVHTHAPHCTALAMLRRPIPAVHYMVAAFGGPVRCAPYATFGTPELAAHTLAALEGRTACLLANHGMVAVGADLGRALWLAAELETLARQYCLSLAIGTPVPLTDAEMADAARAFASYRPSDRREHQE